MIGSASRFASAPRLADLIWFNRVLFGVYSVANPGAYSNGFTVAL